MNYEMEYEAFSVVHYDHALSALWNDYTAADSLYFEEFQKYGAESAEERWGPTWRRLRSCSMLFVGGLRGPGS